MKADLVHFEHTFSNGFTVTMDLDGRTWGTARDRTSMLMVWSPRKPTLYEQRAVVDEYVKFVLDVQQSMADRFMRGVWYAVDGKIYSITPHLPRVLMAQLPKEHRPTIKMPRPS